MRRIFAIMGVALVAMSVGLGVSAAAPAQAEAANIRYWNTSVPPGNIKWTWHAGYGQIISSWGSIYKNGGSWANWFSYSPPLVDYVGAYSSANPVSTSNPNPLALVYIGCENNNGLTIIASCWAQQ